MPEGRKVNEDPVCVRVCHLCDQELGDPLREASFLTGQDHLQHVSMELLHDDKHSLWGLEHAVQVDHARMVQALERGGGGIIFICQLLLCKAKGSAGYFFFKMQFIKNS